MAQENVPMKTMKTLMILSPLHKAIRQVDIHLAEHTRALGVSNTEGHLLTYLASYAPCPISELHRVFGLKRSTLTSLLDRLESRGLVRRKSHPEDRRSLLVALRPGGRRLAGKLHALVNGFEDKVLAAVKPAHLAGFRKVLETIERVSEVEVRPTAKR